MQRSLPLVREEQVDGLAVGKRVEIGTLVVVKVVLRRGGQRVGKDKTRFAPTVASVGRERYPDFAAIGGVEVPA